jgi:ceramide glucosyltransferase
MVSFISSLVAAVLALCGMGFYVLCLWSVRTFIKDNRKPHPEFTPPVSILKPLRGVDPQMYAVIASRNIPSTKSSSA